MQNSMFWRLAAILLIASVFYLGHGLHDSPKVQLPSLQATAFAAGVGTPTEATEVILTSSENGRIVYLWQFSSSRPPRFLGQSSVDK